MKAEVWHDRVTIVYSDMRKWKAPEKVKQLEIVLMTRLSPDSIAFLHFSV